MRPLLAALVLALPTSLAAQEASKQEAAAVQSIVECLVQGLPHDWVRAEMTVELAAPGAASGDVEYTAVRRGAEDRRESFTPCDVRKPARTLLDGRKSQAAARRGWTRAVLVVQPDGKFSLNFEYPKKDDKRRMK
ncbi:MAG TPA: hypothetical protein VFB08_09275 [Burkholderiales bacterium]|nr:hypothetical protein [Burkholderiales bacterium]